MVHAIIKQKYFNSTMVRLKVKTSTAATVENSDFNSTMVRLKEGGGVLL